MRNIMQERIKRFKSKPGDFYLTIGGCSGREADMLEQMRQDLESDIWSADIEDVLGEEDFVALSDYVNFGENGCGTVNNRLICELYDLVYTSVETRRCA